MMSSTKTATAHLPETVPCSVLVVDDSAVARGLIARWLEDTGEIIVRATAANGEGALAMVRAYDIDVVVLDIEMPGMDGLEALPRLLELAPHLQIMMASTLTERNAEISLRAMELGAVDYVAKPSNRGLQSATVFQGELVGKVKALAERARKLRDDQGDARQLPRFIAAPAPRPAVRPAVKKAGMAVATGSRLRLAPSLLAIGSSTGGPQAIFALLSALAKPLSVPVVITQHMPPTFTPILAQHITRITGLAAAEARNGETLQANRVYVAPGDNHFEIDLDAGVLKARITQDPPENFCRPAVDPMFRSIARAVGDRALCVVLTGMGRDGAAGAVVVSNAGGIVMAQDEASSVVWGMPRAVYETGIAELVAPVEELAARITSLCNGGRK